MQPSTYATIAAAAPRGEPRHVPLAALGRGDAARFSRKASGQSVLRLCTIIDALQPAPRSSRRKQRNWIAQRQFAGAEPHWERSRDRKPDPARDN